MRPAVSPSSSRFVLLLLISLAALGCDPVAHPGESVGTFLITGSLDDNGCGAAVPALDPISFEVELRDDYGRGLWVMSGDHPLQTGIRLPDGAYRFRSGTTVPVINPTPTYRGCALQQVEFIEVRVSVFEDEFGEPVMAELPDASVNADAGIGAATGVELEIDGINEIQFTPTMASDCSPLPVVNGGPWAALPCTLHYTLFGTGVGVDPATLGNADEI